MTKLKMWWTTKLYNWAVKIIKSHGFSVVRIVNRAGTDYLVGNDGRFYQVGKKTAR